MKEATYIGDNEVNLGRFGLVKTGQTISLTEQEWPGIESDCRFKLKKVSLSEAVSKAAKKALPYGTSKFDLRTVPWGNKNLFRILESRANKDTLFKVIAALRIVGAPVREVGNSERRVFIVDAVVECGRICGWDKMGKKEVEALPPFDLTKYAWGDDKTENFAEENKPNSADRAKPVRKRKRAHISK